MGGGSGGRSGVVVGGGLQHAGFTLFKILKLSQVAHNIMVWGGKMGMGADGGLQCLVE